MMAETEAEQATRHTLGEAARLLRISRHTLDKWLERLGIEPARHAYDYRFFTISAEQLQAIRDARAQMPDAQQSPILGTNALRSPSADFAGEKDKVPLASHTLAPRQRPMQRATFASLPDGCMSKEDASRLHGVPTSTLRRWCREGHVETTPGQYPGEGGRYGVIDPITAHGLAQLWTLAHERQGFTPCPGCPHAEDTQIAD